MKIENTEVYGWRAALRAMRNPMDSWGKSDSWIEEGATVDSAYGLRPLYAPLSADGTTEKRIYCDLPGAVRDNSDYTGGGAVCREGPCIGPEDLKLACKLIRGGSEHRKFMRQIIVWVDFTLPRYVWQEADTYKVATVRNSCSTMHKLGSAVLALEAFQDDDVLPEVLMYLNQAGAALRAKAEWIPPGKSYVLKGEEIKRWMKKHMPEGFLQRATMTFSYETLLAMHRQRKNHRLPEWSGVPSLEWKDVQVLCEWIRSLPYMAKFIEASEGK